jgi:hypothetical protein
MTVNEAPPSLETPASLEHIKRIWDILQETSGFDAMQLLPVIPQLLMKPETQRMGQKIAGGLVQRVAARLIRDVLLQDTPPKASHKGHTPRTYPPTSPRFALPPAVAR